MLPGVSDVEAESSCKDVGCDEVSVGVWVDDTCCDEDEVSGSVNAEGVCED